MTVEDESTEVNEESVDQQDADVLETSTAMFSGNEARVLASLMEKELTVPDNYPLTINSLVLACNQKSNREPVMKLTEGEVGHIARTLADRGFIKLQYGDRAQKVEHRVRENLNIDIPQQALLTVMMLRAPQTLNDLKTRTSRMTDFEDLEDIQLHLEMLNDREEKLMQLIPKGPGQREDRYTHLLCGEVEITQYSKSQSGNGASEQANLDISIVEKLIQRIDELEQRIQQLEQAKDISVLRRTE